MSDKLIRLKFRVARSSPFIYSASCVDLNLVFKSWALHRLLRKVLTQVTLLIEQGRIELLDRAKLYTQETSRRVTWTDGEWIIDYHYQYKSSSPKTISASVRLLLPARRQAVTDPLQVPSHTGTGQRGTRTR